MKALLRLLYFLCFAGLAIVAAFALNGICQPSIAAILERAVLVAALCGAPGLIHRKLWPLALVLLPVGAYLLMRTVTPLPAGVDGFGAQYHFYTEQLQLGATAYTHATFPLPVTDAPELKLLLAFLLYWLMGAAAFLCLSLRRPLPAIMLILALLGYSLTVDASTRTLWPAILFVILVACLFVFARALKREGWRLWDAVAGGAVGVVAALLALALLVTTPSVVANPWQDWRTWDPFAQGGSVYTFNWLQEYPAMLDPANNRPIMRVESASPSYWRANALDMFTGTAWLSSRAFLLAMEPVQTGGKYVYSMPATELVPAGKPITEIFTVESVYTNYFFVGGDPRSLTIDQNIALRMNNMRSLRVGQALGPSLAYSLTAVIPAVKPTDLVALGTDYPEDVDMYLSLPFPRAADIEGPDKDAAWRGRMADDNYGPGSGEWVGLYALNQGIIGDATDPYEITLRLERYLRRSYSYSLNPPPSNYSSPCAAFLFDTRSGYCQHFAGAMAALLRYNGIPARVAVGFTSGETVSRGVYLVSTNNAHAWVEVYFPRVGWVAFDPTPGRTVPFAGASSTSPGFINPFVDDGASSPGTVDTEPPTDNPSEGLEVSGDTAGAQGRGWLSRAAWLPWVAGLVVVLAGWPVVRSLWRSRRIRRGPPDERLRASLALLRTNLADYRVSATSARTLEEIMQILQAHLGIEPDLRFVDRAEAVLFGGRTATAEDVERAEALRRGVRTRLRKRHGWVRTGFAWYGMPRLSFAGGQKV
jgi:transglutaminase-like putative cysteine protease